MTGEDSDVLASINDLSDVAELFEPLGALTNWSEGFEELFSSGNQLMRYGEDTLLVFRNEDLRQLGANPAVGNMPADTMISAGFSGTAESLPHLFKMMSHQLFTSNPPVHGPVRQVFVRAFGPKAMADFLPIAERNVADLIAEYADRGEIDFSYQFAEHLTARFWGDVFGMTDAEKQRIAELVREMLPWFIVARTEAGTATLNAATEEYLALLTAAIRRAINTGENSLLSAMSAQFDAIDVEGRPEHFEVVLASNWIDAFHTAALASTNVLYHLLRNPAAMAEVARDPSLVQAAVAEGIRLSGPVILTPRYALEDLSYKGIAIPQGTVLVMLWAAGTRDPDAYPDPDAFDLSRVHRADTSTGGGVHVCPGRHLARMLAGAVVRGLTAPGIAVRLTGDVAWMPRSAMWQPERLPVEITRV